MKKSDLQDDFALLAELAELPEDVVKEKRARRRGGRDSMGHISRLGRTVVVIAKRHGANAVLAKANGLMNRVGQLVSAVTQPVKAVGNVVAVRASNAIRSVTNHTPRPH
jgi:hypothetical protein